MGVPGPLIEIFLHEHRNRPWRGRLLTLGRQTIVVDAPRLHHLLAAHGIPCDPVRAAYDNVTVAASNAARSQFITDGTLFAWFAPDLRLDVMDVTDYEGANLIWNMCEPVPHHPRSDQNAQCERNSAWTAERSADEDHWVLRYKRLVPGIACLALPVHAEQENQKSPRYS
jgi:hypothetical protein